MLGNKELVRHVIQWMCCRVELMSDLRVCWQVHAVSQVHSAERHQQRVAAAAWQDNRMHQSDWPRCQSRKGVLSAMLIVD